MRHLALLACAALSVPAFAPVAAAETRPALAAAPDARSAAFGRDYAAFVQALIATGYAPPGFVVVVSDGERVLFEHAYGVRDVATGRPMTLDTPIYSASTTKSYVGLLAARMDAQGVLRLDQTLADVWPDLTLPAPLDPSRVAITGLLSHSSGMVDSGANFRSNISGDLNAANIDEHLSRFASAREGFAYSNLGPFLYSMMLEIRTGRDWREALSREVFQPLGLTRTAIRIEDLPQDQIARCNTRLSGAWRSVPLKDPALLNAGGGVYTSGRDAARWVQAFATHGASAGGRVPAAELDRTWAPASVQQNDANGLKRDGYGLGWDLSDYDGQRWVTRSGGYTGCASIVGFAPDTGLSVAVLAVGDSSLFGALLLKQAADLWNARPEAAANATARADEYTQRLTRFTAEVDAVVAPDLTAHALPVETLRAYEGVYDDGDRLGRFRLRIESGRLVAAMGPSLFDLVPTGQPDAFQAWARFDSPAYAAFEYQPLPFRFERDAAGRVLTLNWESRVFPRTE